MSFFKDFKEDLSQAVNELIPDEDFGEEFDDEEMVNTLEEEPVELSEEIEQLDELLEAAAPVEAVEEPVVEETVQPVVEETVEEVVAAAPVEQEVPVQTYEMKEEKTVDNTINTGLGEATNAVTVITGGTRIVGSIESEGSVEIEGVVEGNVVCNGKITVTGAIKGDTVSSEFFADSARLEGEVKSSGTVKVGLGSVIVGNIQATSAVIAGAVKGDVDVQGPVVVDTSAVVMGNIKSRSVQINNGAVIEGFCSQCYADIDVKGIFGV